MKLFIYLFIFRDYVFHRITIFIPIKEVSFEEIYIENEDLSISKVTIKATNLDPVSLKKLANFKKKTFGENM